MANKILLDTSVLIDLQRGNQKTIDIFKKVHSKCVISRITACEFIYGSRDSKEKKLNKQFIESLQILEVNENISKYAYLLIDQYGLKTKFGISDALIAATCIVTETKLWTLNKKHFSKFKDLEIL